MSYVQVQINRNFNDRSDDDLAITTLKFKTGLIMCVCTMSMLLGIISFIIGTLSTKGTCPHIDEPTGLSIEDYLIGVGISQLIFGMFLSIMVCLITRSDFDSISDGLGIWFVWIVIFICRLFTFAWFFVGAFILFRSNIECINDGEIKTVYALVMWIFSAISVTQNGKKSSK